MSISIRKVIKGAVYKLFPRFAGEWFSARSRAYSQALVKKWGCTELNRKLIERYGNRVLHGPFQNVVLSPMACCEHLSPYLLGTYESELHPVWERVFSMRFSQVLDIGSKFGFYAVALSRRFPDAQVLAFDTDPWARSATEELNEANSAKVLVRGFCDPMWLRENVQERAFILSDCEGYEGALFGTLEVPQLASATMLIEIHEQFSPGVTDLIRGRYSNTHEITLIPTGTNDAKVVAELADLTSAEQSMATSEFRTSEQCWLFLVPKDQRVEADFEGMGVSK